jgi:hypothetical protein
MKRSSFSRYFIVRGSAAMAILSLLLGSGGNLVRADVVQMQNGDRYSGDVVSIRRDMVLVESEVLGKVRLPRGKVARILLGTNELQTISAPLGGSNRMAKAVAAQATNSSPEVSAMLRQLGAHTNLIRQVQSQFLAGAGKEANDQFNQMLSGLINGTLSLNDLAAQARSASDQLRATRKDAGEDGIMIDSYLAILDHFLKEMPAPPVSQTNVPRVRPKSDSAETE